MREEALCVPAASFPRLNFTQQDQHGLQYELDGARWLRKRLRRANGTSTHHAHRFQDVS